ncbi:prepilin-type N-terminal cleavage/methylation domain-containing protein [Levilactobacillus koreensis]|uniref:Competence protein ComGC n=1 Tax=Levilactobacillus koreensis TaxID=637971 RepID=A0AAC8UTW2_9LACO|nr:prepilin-type N-terminal cleavage/methylation domain-containing protein [Levilactobacillus koreensis]AKP63624.1 competence protein ComGC [Levilactobacillus koreensis]
MHRRQGFTLIEMTIVLFIISLLVLIILPNLNGQRQRAQGIHRGAMTTVVQGQVTAYIDDYVATNHVTPNVTYAKLTGKYLTADQVKSAKAEGLVIDKNEVKQVKDGQ